TRYSVLRCADEPLEYCTSSHPGPTWDHGTGACAAAAADGCAVAVPALSTPATANPATHTPVTAAIRPRHATLLNIPAPFPSDPPPSKTRRGAGRLADTC